MPFLITLLALAAGLVNLYSWKKHKDRNFLWFALVGIILLIASLWGYVDINIYPITAALTYLLIVGMSWYQWKRVRHPLFLYVLSIVVFATIMLFYDSYIKGFLDLSSGTKSVIRYLRLGIYIVLWIGMIRSVLFEKKSGNNRDTSN